MVTREAIEKRMAELENERNHLINKLQAITGALQDCAYWLEQLEQPEEPESEE